MKNRANILIPILMLMILGTSCGGGDKIVITGVMHGSPTRAVFLEELWPSGAKIVDSTKTNNRGKFKFTIKAGELAMPMFYNVRMGGQSIKLLVDKGERVVLNAIGNIENNYTVEGSDGSRRIREYVELVQNSNFKMDSLEREINLSVDYASKMEAGRRLSRELMKSKGRIIRYLVFNATSPAALMPLYMDNNHVMTPDNPQDLKYLKMVADSLGSKYPDMPMVKALRKDVQTIEDIFTMEIMLSESVDQITNFPDLAIKDASGDVKRLQDLVGKTIMVAFTSTSDPQMAMITHELRDVYAKFNPETFQIYEVDIDTDQVKWLDNVTKNNFPWIRVCDFEGLNSSSLKIYNVRTLPQYFIISSDSEIVGAHMGHEAMMEMIDGLVKN